MLFAHQNAMAYNNWQNFRARNKPNYHLTIDTVGVPAFAIGTPQGASTARATPTLQAHRQSQTSPLKTPSGPSYLRQSTSIESPARISATKKVPSAAFKGGLALNSPHNDPVENAFSREGNRVAGFGPGMASALIGNASRRGKSITVSETKDTRTALASIGWGVRNPTLDQGVWHRVLEGMPHKKAYDFDGLKYLPHMDTTGKFAQHLDNQLGLPYDLLNDLSVREQRVIVKRRIEELRRIENQKIRSMTKSPTKPIDTPTNTRLYLRSLDRKNTQVSQQVS